MKPINDWDNIQPAQEREQLPLGAYLVKIMDAKEVVTDKSSRLDVSIDIAEGEYKDFYAKDYKGQNRENKRWRGVLRQFIPKEDGSDMDGFTKSNFKRFMNAIEESNSGFHWDWDERKLKGLVVGCVFRSEEWEFNGKSGWTVKPFLFIPVDKYRDGEFKLPEDRPLQNKSQAASTQFSKNTSDDLSDEDLPF